MPDLKETLTITIEYDDGKEEGYEDELPGFTAYCDEIGLVTEGETFEELLANLREVLPLCLEDTDLLEERGIAITKR